MIEDNEVSVFSNSSQEPAGGQTTDSKKKFPSRLCGKWFHWGQIGQNLNSGQSRWRDVFILLVVILLAGIPPVLVMANRWFEIKVLEVMKPIWCRSPFLCRSMLPSYFLVVFCCLGLLLVFIFIFRNRHQIVVEYRLEPASILPISDNQKKAGLIYLVVTSVCFTGVLAYNLITWTQPGWNLVFIWLFFMAGCFFMSFPWDLVKTIWQKNDNLYLSLMMFHAAIIALLWGLYEDPGIFWLTAGLVILSAFNFWRFKQKIPVIFWILTLALVVFTINLNVWQTAVVGDEYSFLYTAQEILAKPGVQALGDILFKADGAHGSHPMFSSILQALSMLVLGNNNFGWRFSNPYLCMLSVALFYAFCRSFISKRQSLLAAFLMAVSSCLMSFSKIGYNNLQALFAMTLLLATATWALRSRNLFTYACLGSELAFCFYTYPAALYVMPLPLLLLVLYDFPRTRQKIQLWFVMALTTTALVFPILMQPAFWTTKVFGTFFHKPDMVQSSSAMIYHVLSNLLYSAFNYLFIVEESHFIAVSYLDPITCGFFVIGFCLMLFQMHRQKFPLFILFSYIFFILVIGTSHDLTHPPNTRMFLFIPLYMLIASWGVGWIWEQIKLIKPMTGNSPRILVAAFVILLTSINLYQAYPLSHVRFAPRQSFESLFLRVAARVRNVGGNSTKTFAVIVDENWGVDGLLALQQIYRELEYVEIVQIRIKEPPIPDEYSVILQDKNTVVFFFAGMDPSWYKPLGDQLRGFNKESCEITTTAGQRRFTLYRDPELPQACYP